MIRAKIGKLFLFFTKIEHFSIRLFGILLPYNSFTPAVCSSSSLTKRTPHHSAIMRCCSFVLRAVRLYPLRWLTILFSLILCSLRLSTQLVQFLPDESFYHANTNSIIAADNFENVVSISANVSNTTTWKGLERVYDLIRTNFHRGGFCRSVKNKG